MDHDVGFVNLVQKTAQWLAEECPQIKTKNEINLQRKKLEERFLAARTIPGTRSFHNYKPLSSDSLELRRVTCSNLPSLVFSFDKNVSQWSCIRPQPNAYVAAVYDEKWYFALVKNVCDDKEDAELLFLHPPGPAVSFFWPYREEFIQKN
ncbi:hypothetical protein JTE90_008644 [Oedothorax gibbosus]|uniref:Uncharacterized protein n=1 Tax=Oedothorax gibbosus TaxID=931172 RepID=A0AAV6TZM6_9ARAC|nr:hypothetical protein JTE90_008644 [Oedothorax gibbosus]